MLSPLRNRFGIPGVISVIALVFAMLGGAYAANNSGDGKATASAKAKKGPRGPKGATGPAGPAGPAGPQGPAGANGKDGSNGANGSNGATGATGANGQSVASTVEAPGANCASGGYKLVSASGTQYVCNGAKGATGPTGPAGEGGEGGEGGLPATLPSGKTMTGTWLLKNPTAGFASNMFAPLSFPIPLSSADAASIEAHVWTEDSAPTSPCTGTPSQPTAAPGDLCVYVGATEPPGAIVEASTIRKPDLTEGIGTSGALLYSEFMTANEYLVGSFAVTAP